MGGKARHLEIEFANGFVLGLVVPAEKMPDTMDGVAIKGIRIYPEFDLPEGYSFEEGGLDDVS